MKITAEGKLQSAYAKRGYFLTFRSNGQYIISDKDRPLRGNLKLYSRDVIDNVDETIAKYEKMAKEVEATENKADRNDLLEAAQQIVWKLNHNHSVKGDGSDCKPAKIDRNDATVRALINAIRKATGE